MFFCQFNAHEMAEEHTEFSPSLCVCVSFRLHVPESCLAQNFVLHGGINNLAQMIFMTRQCVTNKNHVARSKVKVIVPTITVHRLQ